MKKRTPQFRIGNGYDIHRLKIGRNLTIGEILIGEIVQIDVETLNIGQEGKLR